MTRVTGIEILKALSRAKNSFSDVDRFTFSALQMCLKRQKGHFLKIAGMILIKFQFSLEKTSTCARGPKLKCQFC
jgi:hypothetical protein